MEKIIYPVLLNIYGYNLCMLNKNRGVQLHSAESTKNQLILAKLLRNDKKGKNYEEIQALIVSFFHTYKKKNNIK